MQWHQPIMAEGIKPNNFAWWIYASIFLLSFLLYSFILFFLNQATNLISLFGIVFNLIIMPLIMAIACVLFVYNYYLTLKYNYQFRSRFIQSKKQLWKNWLQQSVSVLGFSYVSAIENNAIKIIGLDEGITPKAGQNLKISYIDNQLNSRINKIIKILLDPLVKELQQNSRYRVIDIYAPDVTSELKEALTMFSQKNNLKINMDEQVNFLSSIPDVKLINKLIKNEKEERLLIILSLHSQNNMSTSEFAVALLLAKDVLTKANMKTKIYRPLETNLVDLSGDFTLLINSEQANRQNLRHVWGVNMIDSAMNTVISEAVENNLLIDVNNFHRMDLYEGIIDKSHGWLALAYACEAINHGQKGQLIALQIEEQIHLLQVEKSKEKPINNQTENMNYFPLTYLISVILLLISLCFLSPDYETRKTLLLVVLGSGFFFCLVLGVFTPLKKRLQTKKLEYEWRLLGDSLNE